MCDLTVGAVIQVNFSCFVLLYSNTTIQKTIISMKYSAGNATPYNNNANNHMDHNLKCIKLPTFHGTSLDICHTQS